MAVTASTGGVQLHDIATIAREKVKAVITAAEEFAPPDVQEAIEEAWGVISERAHSIPELGELHGGEGMTRGVSEVVGYPVKGVSAGSGGWMSSAEYEVEIELPSSKTAVDGGGVEEGGGATSDDGGWRNGGGANSDYGKQSDGGGATSDSGKWSDVGGAANDGGGASGGAVGDTGTGNGGEGENGTSKPELCSAVLEGTAAFWAVLADCLRFAFRVLCADARSAQWELVVAAVDEMEKACKKVDGLCDRVRVAPPRQEIYMQPRVLADVVNALRAPESRVVVVHGLPTLGKSSLAKEVIWLSKSGVRCLINCSNPPSLHENNTCTRENA